MGTDTPSRAEKLVKELNQRATELAAMGAIPVLEKSLSRNKDVETPEMRKKRREALEKLRTFLD